MNEVLDVRIGSKLHTFHVASPLLCRCGWTANGDCTTWVDHITAIVRARTVGLRIESDLSAIGVDVQS